MQKLFLNKKILSCLLWLTSFLLYEDLAARHIIGGDVRYICLGKNVANDSVHYKVIFKMYRDSRSGGANFDDSVQFGIYRKGNNNTWIYEDRVISFVENISEIPPNNNDPCIIVPTNLGVEEGLYEFEIWLPIITTDYMIAYQRCCRNPTISNLLNPNDTGAAFTITISALAQQTCNNSPEFIGFPPVVLCVNEPLLFDHSTQDVENDQVIYEFCSPLASGGQRNNNTCMGVIPSPAICLPPFNTVNFLLPGFSFSVPMAGAPTVSIHPTTGLISGTPQITGQFVVGVCIKEYRNGVLLTSTQRDFQFNVQQCGRVVTPKIQTNIVDKDTFIFNSCHPTSIRFNNISLGGSFIHSYDWEFLNEGFPIYFNTKNVEINFDERGTFYGKLILNKFIGCKDSAFVKVNIFPEIAADFDFNYDTCIAGPIQFINNSFSDAGEISMWNWSSEGISLESVENPIIYLEKTGITEISLEVIDKNNCRDTLIKDINWQPVPSLVILEPDMRESCVPAKITFSNLSKPVDETYKIQWSFSNGISSSEFQPVVKFDQPGSYSVDLEIISPIGCVTKKSFIDAITVYPKPVAGYSTLPDTIDNFNNEVQILDQSIASTSSSWLLNGQLISLEKEPTFVMRDTGIHQLQQVVFNIHGCSDTMIKTIDVIPRISFFMPTAFTPNRDGLNDVFLPVGYFSGIRNYKCTITNKWGEKIYETFELNNGWDGKYRGIESPIGVYLYQIEYTEPRRKIINSKGMFSLVK